MSLTMPRQRAVAVVAAAAFTLLLLGQPLHAYAGAAAVTSPTCTVTGSPEPEMLVGTDAADVICGRGGNDVIRGLGGSDIVLGGPGDDELWGGAGNDAVSGGLGTDTLAGRPGDDQLAGGAGDDSLEGGVGADSNYGGSGSDICLFDSADLAQTSCKSDQEPPSIGELIVEVTDVDVSNGPAEVAFTVHATDDIEVARAGAYAWDPYGNGGQVQWGAITSGGARDGWWNGSLLIEQGAPPGTYSVNAMAVDGVGRSTSAYDLASVTVQNDHYDGQLPELVSTSVEPTSGDFPLDVTNGDQQVRVTAVLTDNQSGVAAPDACLMPPVGDHFSLPSCAPLHLETGDRLEGTWQATINVPAGSNPGDWGLRLWVSDAANNGRSHIIWIEADHYADWCRQPCAEVEPLADGVGVVPVTNSGIVRRANLVSVDLDPTEVNTHNAPATIHIEVHAIDGSPAGIESAVIGLYPPDIPNQPEPVLSIVQEPTSGTRNDGIWSTKVTLPKALPPGEYSVYIGLSDATTHVRYVAPQSYLADLGDSEPLTPEQLISGVAAVTVV